MILNILKFSKRNRRYFVQFYSFKTNYNYSVIKSRSISCETIKVKDDYNFKNYVIIFSMLVVSLKKRKQNFIYAILSEKYF